MSKAPEAHAGEAPAPAPEEIAINLARDLGGMKDALRAARSAQDPRFKFSDDMKVAYSEAARLLEYALAPPELRAELTAASHGWFHLPAMDEHQATFWHEATERFENFGSWAELCESEGLVVAPPLEGFADIPEAAPVKGLPSMEDVRQMAMDNPVNREFVESRGERRGLLTRERPVAAAAIYTFPAYVQPAPGVTAEVHLDALYGERVPVIKALFDATDGRYTGIGTSPVAIEGLTVNEVEIATRWLEMENRISTARDAQDNPMDYGFTPSEIEGMARSVERWRGLCDGMQVEAEPIMDRMRANVRHEAKRVELEQRSIVIPDMSGVAARAAALLPTIKHIEADKKAVYQAVFEAVGLPAGHPVYPVMNRLVDQVPAENLSGMLFGEAQDALHWIVRRDALQTMHEDSGIYDDQIPRVAADHAADMNGRLAAARIGAHTYPDAALYNNCLDGKAPTPDQVASYEALVIHPVRIDVDADGDYVRCAENEVSGRGLWSVYARRRAPDVGEVCITDGPSTGDALADKSAAVEVARHLAREWKMDLEYGPFSRDLEEDIAFGAVGFDQESIKDLHHLEVKPVWNIANSDQPAEFLVNTYPGHIQTYAVFGITENDTQSIVTVVPVSPDLDATFTRATEIAEQLSKKWDVHFEDHPFMLSLLNDNRGMGM